MSVFKNPETMKSTYYFLLGFIQVSLSFGQKIESAEQNLDYASTQKFAAQIDDYIKQFHKKHAAPDIELVSDEKFLRRAYLVGIGRIPTSTEIDDFFTSKDMDKRQALVQKLMVSKGYSSHMSNWAFDLLRVREQIGSGNRGNFATFRDWVRRAIDENMPWDQMVENLVDSHGNAWNPEEAAVGFYLMDRGMPLDQMANSMRIFLGSRMECAQCHDDPFGDTTQKDFYQLAAFTEGQSIPHENIFKKTRRLNNPLGRDVGRALLGSVIQMAMEKGGDGKIRLPKDYQYKDADANEWIGAKTPFGNSIDIAKHRGIKNGREKFAEWIVSGTNEQFSAVIANRMWQRVMGQGIYEPVDDYIAAQNTVHPELMSYLSKLMQELDYDLKAFQTVLMSSKFFQYESDTKAESMDLDDQFHGRRIARLSAEQIWDSMLTLIKGNPDIIPANFNRAVSKKDDVREAFGDVVTPFEFSERVLSMEKAPEYQEYAAELLKLSEAKGQKTKGKMNPMMDMGNAPKRSQNQFQRASELGSPVPRHHFLAIFGASDRAITENGNKEPNVSQVLALMNGTIQNHLIYNRGAAINQSLSKYRKDSEKMEHTYLQILNRSPRKEEVEWMREEIRERAQDGYKNIISSLLMSSEFLYLQ